jgi:hypothetical protein
LHMDATFCLYATFCFASAFPNPLITGEEGPVHIVVQSHTKQGPQTQRQCILPPPPPPPPL